MKILFLLTQDLESPSGLGRYFPLARELAGLGHVVTIAALHPDYSCLPRKRFLQEGVDVWYVAPMHVRKRGNIKSYYSTPALLLLAARATFRLARAAATVPADILHIAKPHPMNSLAGLWAKRMRPRRVFLDCDDYEVGVGHFRAGWQRWGVDFFEKRMPFLVDMVTTHTHFTRERLLAAGLDPQRVFYLSNGVDRTRFLPPQPESVEALRQKLSLSGKKVVAFIGSLSRPGHPVELLLEAFTGVQSEVPQSVLLVVGGGDDFERLQDRAAAMGLKDKVVFTGRIPPDQVVQFYALAQVSVDPVYDDAAARGRSPLKLFESWMCGVPFVTGDVGDRRFLLGHPPAGLLATPGDPLSLGEAIVSVLTNDELAEELRQRGLRRATPYDWQNLAQELSNLYSRLIRAPEAPVA